MFTAFVIINTNDNNNIIIGQVGKVVGPVGKMMQHVGKVMGH